MRSMRGVLVLLLLAGFLVCSGCGAPEFIDTSLVEVRVVGLWTHADYDSVKSLTAPKYYPHTIVEEVETAARYRVFGNAIGATGEVFKVRRCDLRNAGR